MTQMMQNRHEPLVRVVASVLAPVIPAPWDVERSRNMCVSLLSQPRPQDDETVWTECVAVLRYRTERYPELSFDDLDELALRVLRAFVLHTWKRPPSRWEMFVEVRSMGAPSRWLARLQELEVVGEGAA